MNKKMTIYFIVVLLIDQITKIICSLTNVNLTVIPGFFSLSYIQNTGAAWSILQGKNLLLIIIGIAMLFVLYSFIYKYPKTNENCLAFGLLFSGVVGNLLDRIFYGYVRDFIAFSFGKYAYPVFNIADSAIVIGVIILIVSLFKESKHGSKSK